MARRLKEIKDSLGVRKLAPANYVKIKYGTGEVRLESNGEIAGLEINYRGAFHGVNKLGSGWTIKASKNKILIISLSQIPISELLFSYIGELRILDAKYVTWDNKLKYAGIENLNRNDWNLAKGNWGADGRKYEEVQTYKIIYKKFLKSRI